jgi:hypothetical protein
MSKARIEKPNQLFNRPNTLNRHREIRDVYNKLRKKYALPVVYTFFKENYFMQPSSVDQTITYVDKEPVNLETASIIYKTVMRDDFHL